MATAPPAASDGDGNGGNGGNGQPQQGDEPPKIIQCLNMLMYFFVLQSIMSFIAGKFFHPQGGESSPLPSPMSRTEAYFRGEKIEQGNVPSEGGTVLKKPLGATHQHQFPKERGGKPSCLWDHGTVMDLDVIITDSPLSPLDWPLITTIDPNDDYDAGSERSQVEDGKATDPSSRGATGSGVQPRRTKVKLGGKPRKGGNNKPSSRGKILAEWTEKGLVLGGQSKASLPSAKSFVFNGGDDANRRNTTVELSITEALANNETHVYAHVRLQRRRRKQVSQGNGAAEGENVRRDDVLVKRIPLTRHRKRKKMRDEKSLLDSGKNSTEGVHEVKLSDSSVLTAASLNKTHDQILLYLKSSMTLQLVEFSGVDFPSRSGVPSQFSDHMDWYEGEAGDDGSVGHRYYPIVYHSQFWVTYDSLKEVNGTLKESNIELTFEPVSMWKWQLQSQMEESWKKQESFTGEEDASNDIFRNVLLETNPYLLAVTAVVSCLHTVFDILAFKNDISFFKGKKSMEGLSLRSMIINCFFSLVILLYLADNDTSYMVLMSNGIGLVIEVWKISKVISIKFEGGKMQWVEAQSYKKSRTKEYDEIATTHLLFVTMPLVSGYGMYSLLYQKHRGWYSWILNTLVGFIYMFGFVMMTPQLFINYKLQSVAHLNMRTMTYKSINTFIDDLFAFVIKMPIMHRLACLRDDVIYFIFCYQRYKYRTDYSRANEFGQCLAPTEEMVAEREEEAVLSASTQHREGIKGDDAAAGSSIRKRRCAREKRIT